ncbi:hypothetical protein G9A89_019030 [Geosiphon pyriformis]|nr:hypothetical protein G9A89_019030 [Geosiphon pyriformis]
MFFKQDIVEEKVSLTPYFLRILTISSDVLLFVNTKLANPVAGGSGSISAGLGNQPNTKKKIGVGVIDSSTGPLGLADIGVIDDKFSKSWNSKMESEVISISGLSDLENMKNIVTEETSYANSDNSVVNSMEDNITLRKTCTYTYVLD